MQKTQETQIRSLGGGDALEEDTATHSSILAGKCHGQRRGAWWATVHKVAESEAVVESCLSLCDPVDCSTPGFLFLTISQSLPKFLFMPSSHRIL